MSVSTLPEWKQLLLERKRREEEERERREREEEEKLASMPAWKRGIIQRRRAKQDEGRERERDREGVLAMTEDVKTDQTDSKLTVKPHNHISTDTISPVRQNPFISKENSWRRERRGNEASREFWRGRDREPWAERTESKSEGRERDRSTGREQVKERERREREECRETDSSTSLFPQVTGLRTIKAENIIIIEKDKNGKERLEKSERDREQGVQEEERRMRMDLREFLAAGGSVTEIRASEVLIIKPSVTEGKTGAENPGAEERGNRETDVVGTERDRGKEGIWRKEREKDPILPRESCMQTTLRTATQKEERIQNHEDRGGVECAGRVSQLLSKFGEHPKPPTRSKSTDCFIRPGRNQVRHSTGDLHVLDERRRDEEDSRLTFRGVPKRSFSFSDRVVCRQNGVCEEEFKVVERTYSDRRVKPHVTVDQSESETKVTRRWGRANHDRKVVMHEKRPKHRQEREKEETGPVCGKADEGDGFTVASVRSPDVLAFARRVSIKHDGREINSEREKKREREENEREMMINTEIQREIKRESEKEEKMKRAIEKQRCIEFQTESNDKTFIDDADSRFRIRVADFSLEPTDQTLLSQHTDRQTELKTTEQMSSHGDMDRQINMRVCLCEADDHLNKSFQDQNKHQKAPKPATDGKPFTSQTPRQIKTPQNKPCSQQEVNIPTTVFYGVDVAAESRRASVPAGDGQITGGGRVERRGSWKEGRPLTRVESLRERIRQQETEREKTEAKVMDDREEDRREAEAEETLKDVMQNQGEETTLRTLRLFDVTQEVSMANSSPQLPVPVSLSLATEREVGEISRDGSQSERYIRQTERDATRHVVQCGTCSIWRRQDFERRADDREREEELLEEDYLPPSLSPSPPLSDSLDAMSRIYNLKTVGSRTAVCISERTTDVSARSGKIQGAQGQCSPVRHGPSPDVLPETVNRWNYGKARDGDTAETVESSGVLAVQRQVERLQLKEQEAECRSHNDKKAQTGAQRSPQAAEQEVRTAEGQKRPDILRETLKSQTQTSPSFPETQKKLQQTNPAPKPQQGRSFTINARSAQPSENSPKPSEGNGPSSSLSPTPSLSPSASPSPPLFSIRSASGGPRKRGTTITITPRKPAGPPSSTGTPAGASGNPSPSRAPPQAQTPAPAPSGSKEAGKKRYPTAEEIEVIGGYQHLKRSCLVKSRGTPKTVKVCFDDSQLEIVCEYPSEDSALDSLSSSSHPGPEEEREEGRCGLEQEEDEEEDCGAFESRSGMNVCAGKIRFLKVAKVKAQRMIYIHTTVSEVLSRIEDALSKMNRVDVNRLSAH